MSLARRTTDGYRVASQVVFPKDRDLDVLPVYLDRNFDDRASGRGFRQDDILSRYALRIREGEKVSFGSYFNAFPAGYWARWSIVDTVRLEVITSGHGQLTVYRSNARGHQMRVTSVALSGGDRNVFDLPLDKFGDGGWYWFDISAGGDNVILEYATWWVPDSGRKFGSATLASTTLNKTDYVIRNLNAIADDAELLDVVDEIIFVDHGSQPLVEADGFNQVKAKLADKLDVITQANLGGSGGFARGQYEAVARGKSDYVILMDDDIELETETITRLICFADLAKTPTLVGAHMFDLLNRSTLHTMGEVVDRITWVPTLPRQDQYLGHSFDRRGLRETTWLHSRIDVDYNGWWCCLIPVNVMKEIGLSLPLFIKWDDAEYGLRALKAGFPTVSLPGSCVWHISWADKDDLVGWQSYFHNRNRIITALIHQQAPKSGEMLKNAEINDIKHLVSMQYYTVAGRLLAERDVLAGPDRLFELLAKRIQDVRAIAKDYPDAVLKTDYEDFPPAPAVRASFTIRPRHMARSELRIEQDFMADEDRPVSRKKLVQMGLAALMRQFKPLAEGSLEAPQTVFRHVDNQWWKVGKVDSALVTNAEGTGISWYKRNPKLMRQMLKTSISNYAKIYRQWESLGEKYRQALPQLTSFESWEKVFGIKPGSWRKSN